MNMKGQLFNCTLCLIYMSAKQKLQLNLNTWKIVLFCVKQCFNSMFNSVNKDEPCAGFTVGRSVFL